MNIALAVKPGQNGLTMCSGSVAGLLLPGSVLATHIRTVAQKKFAGPITVVSSEAPTGERGRQTIYSLNGNILLVTRYDTPVPAGMDDPVGISFVLAR